MKDSFIESRVLVRSQSSLGDCSFGCERPQDSDILTPPCVGALRAKFAEGFDSNLEARRQRTAQNRTGHRVTDHGACCCPNASDHYPSNCLATVILFAHGTILPPARRCPTFVCSLTRP